jgi:hypothetical protein
MLPQDSGFRDWILNFPRTWLEEVPSYTSKEFHPAAFQHRAMSVF